MGRIKISNLTKKPGLIDISFMPDKPVEQCTVQEIKETPVFKANVLVPDITQIRHNSKIPLSNGDVSQYNIEMIFAGKVTNNGNPKIFVRKIMN